MSAKKSTTNFANDFQELEEITRWFDAQEALDLDAGLKKFERGLELASELKKNLQKWKTRWKKLNKNFQTSVWPTSSSVG